MRSARTLFLCCVMIVFGVAWSLSVPKLSPTPAASIGQAGIVVVADGTAPMPPPPKLPWVKKSSRAGIAQGSEGNVLLADGTAPMPPPPLLPWVKKTAA